MGLQPEYTAAGNSFKVTTEDSVAAKGESNIKDVVQTYENDQWPFQVPKLEVHTILYVYIYIYK